MHSRSLVVIVLAAACVLAGSARTVGADTPVAPGNVDGAVVQPPQVAVGQSLVAERLASLGLTTEEVAARMAQLTDEDLVTLADHPEHMALGGVKDKTLIIIAVVLTLPTILLLVLI